MIGVIN